MVFAIHWCESATGVNVSPSPNLPPFYLPPHPIPQGCPSAPALSALFHASNLDWWSISHVVIYMFQRCSLKSSHPRLLLTASLKQSSSASTCSVQILSHPVLWHAQPCSLTFQTLPRHVNYTPATLESPPSIKYFLFSGSFSTLNSFVHIYL